MASPSQPDHQGFLDISHTQSPLTLPFNKQRLVSYYSRPSVTRPRSSRRGNGVPGLGRRRRSKPLKVVQRRESVPGIFTRVGTFVNTGTEWVQEQRNYIKSHCFPHEGPVSLRAVTFGIGIALTITSLAGVCTSSSALIAHPVVVVLQLYQTLFGIATVVIEAKNLSRFESLQSWFSEWFPFLTVPLGKGGLYILMGVLGAALWQENKALAVVGSLIVFCGAIYILLHFGLQTNQLQHVGLEFTQHGLPREDRLEDTQLLNPPPQHLPLLGQNRYYTSRDDRRVWMRPAGSDAPEPPPGEQSHDGLSDCRRGGAFAYPLEYLNGVQQAQREQLFSSALASNNSYYIGNGQQQQKFCRQVEPLGQQRYHNDSYNQLRNVFPSR